MLTHTFDPSSERYIAERARAVGFLIEMVRTYAVFGAIQSCSMSHAVYLQE